MKKCLSHKWSSLFKSVKHRIALFSIKHVRTLALLANVTLAIQTTSHAEEDFAQELPLEQISTLALANYPGIAAKKHAIEAAQAQQMQAYVSPFFQFNVTGSLAIGPEARGTPVFSNDPELPLSNDWQPITYIGVEGVVPVYTFGKLGAAWDAAEAALEASEQDLRLATQKLLFNIRKAYFGLQLALDIKQMVKEGEGKLRKAVERLDARIEDEDPEVTELDRWRLSSTLAEVEARSSEADKLEQISLSALKILSGSSEIPVPECPMKKVVFEIEDLEQYIKSSNRPELKMLDAAIKAQKAKIKAERSKYFPDFALALKAAKSYAPGVTNQSNPFVIDSANRNALGFALVAKWSLDIWGNVYRVQKAEAELAKTNEQANEAKQGMQVELSNAYYELQDAHRREKAWADGEKQTRAWFVSSAQSFEVGALETRELTDAITAYFKARFSHLKTIFDYNLGVASLEKVLGDALVPLDAWEKTCDF